MSREHLLKVVIAALCAIALIGIVVIVEGSEIGEAGGRALATAVVLAYYATTALAANSLRESGESWALLGTIGVGISLAGAVIGVGAALLADEHGEDIIRLAASVAFFAAAAAQGSLLVRKFAEREPVGQWVRLGTFMLALLLASMLTAAVYGDEVDWQAWGVFVVLYALGTILSPLLRLLERSPAGDRAD